MFSIFAEPDFSEEISGRYRGNGAVSAGGNAEIIAVLMFLAISACLSAPESARAQEERTPAADAEVYIYGEEQAIVDAATMKSEGQSDHEYPNELDHVLSVLLTRAYPRPEAHDLVRRTISMICGEVETLAHGKIPDSQRNEWVATVEETKSFESVLKDLQAIAAGQVKREQLINAGLTEMLSATRSKSAGMLSVGEAESIANMRETRGTPSKERGMLGVDVSRWPTIDVLPGMPAAQAGLRDGDVVLRVNTRDVAKTEAAADGLKALRGTADTAISLTVQRGGETLAFEVRRRSAAERIRASLMDPQVVYIQIPLFEGSGIAEQVNELIRKHVTDATSAVILDLRDNIGGRAEEANAVADIFLDEKFLEIFQFRNGRRIAFKSKPGALDVSVIVLTNRNTGSAAEMLALALHDNHRATVIGQPTAGVLFGKDFEKLGDGRMVVFRSEPTVLSPTGKDYSETGLPPDIMVDESKGSGEDKILSRAMDLVRTRAPKDKSQKPLP